MSEGDGGGESAESPSWEENGGNERWWGSQEWVRTDKGGGEPGKMGERRDAGREERGKRGENRVKKGVVGLRSYFCCH